MMDGNNLAERLARLSPAKRALLEKKLRESGRDTSTILAIPRRTERDMAPLSFAQQRLWFINQLDPESPAYHECTALRLAGELDAEALHCAINRIVERHEVLRTNFVAIDGNPTQRIRDFQTVEMQCVDLRPLPVGGREVEAHRVMSEAFRRPFDLGQDFLIRPLLIRLDDREQLLLIVRHHIASDGWSSSVFRRELSILYNAFANREDPDLPELPIQYSDYAVWQRQHLGSDLLKRQLSYWREQLAGVPTINLPTDRARPVVQSSQCGRESLLLPRSLSDRLRLLSNGQGATLFMTLLACFKVFLHRYTGQDDIVVGSPIAGRTRAEIEGLIGFFVNTLVLRTDVSGNPTFKELLARVRDTVLQSFEHQELPFEKLVEDLNPERARSRAPLFQVMFALQNVPWQQLEMTGLTATPVEVESSTGKFDFYAALVDRAQELTLRIEYSTDLFEAVTIRRMMRHFHILLENVAANPAGRIDELPIITDEEKRQLLSDWNRSSTDYPRDHCIHELFARQVDRKPNAVALVADDQQLTYTELNRRANQLAHYLRATGVQRGGLVGICLKRSVELIIALLGVLKAGGAYVPLDPTYPKQRLAFMLEDSRAALVLTDQVSLESLLPTPSRVICLDRDWDDIAKEPQDNPVNQSTADSLAYVIYTSGSTGVPKGVEVRHRGVARLVFGVDYVRLDGTQTALHLASISFDAATFEVWGPLLHGGKCVLFPGRVPSPQKLGEVLKQYHVDTLWLTAALFNTVINEEPQALSDIKQLLIGGETLSVPHVRRGLALLPNTVIINGYGPTESTTFTCCYRIPGQLDDNLTSIPIGRPIANTEVYILDSRLNPVPIGVAGEIYIGGDGLARGYLNQGELTEAKFVAHPFSGEAGAKLYRTGDLARYLWDGNIEFIGRIDNQIKIRGFRIELGEIEWVLTQHAQIRETIVVAQEDVPGEKRLVAYVLGESSVPKEELRTYLKAKLPDYMIPSGFVYVDTFPVTPNGKVDRNALRELGRGQVSTTPDPVVARTPAEAQLAQIWAEVLNIDRFGVQDSFFDLGGHSLLAIRLLARVREKLKFDLPLGRFFEGPTIAHIAEQIESSRQDENERIREQSWSHLFKLKGGDGGNPVYVFPGGFGGENEALVLAQLAHSVGREYPFYGLRARSSQGMQPGHQSVEEMARDFVREIRELQPRGPYYFLGHCLGGVIAYEVACQIEDQGDQVDMLGFLDTVRPTRLRYFRFRAWRVLEKMVPNWKFYYRERLRHHWAQLTRLCWQERVNYLTNRLNTVREVFDLVPAKSTDSSLRSLSLREMRDNQSGHIAALLKYRARPYRGRIHSLVADEMLSRKKDTTLGWKRYVAGGVIVHRGSGDHDSFLRDYTRNIGALVRSWIEEAKNGAG